MTNSAPTHGPIIIITLYVLHNRVEKYPAAIMQPIYIRTCNNTARVMIFAMRSITAIREKNRSPVLSSAPHRQRFIATFIGI